MTNLRYIGELKVFLLALQDMSNNSMTSVKRSIMRSLGTNSIAERVIKEVFNDDITYGITLDNPPLPSPDAEIPDYDEEYENTLMGYYERLCYSLSHREVTGSNARYEIEQFLNCMTGANNCVARYWFTKFLNKQFARGVSYAIVGSVFPSVVNPFTFQKASDFLILHPTETDIEIFKGKENRLEENEWIAQPKLDGFRAIYYNGAMLSSSGKQHYNCEHIIKELQQISQGNEQLVFDGELLADDWNDTSSIVSTENVHLKARSLKYYVFTIMSEHQWMTGNCPLSEEWRIFSMHKYSTGNGMIEDTEQPHIKMVIGKKVLDITEAEALARIYFRQGFEGAVVKRLSAGYNRWKYNRDGVKQINRSDNWRKIKFEETADLPIVGVVMSRDAGKEYNIQYGDYLIASITLLLPDGGTVECGSMTYEDRIFYTKHQSEVVGHFAEVRFQKPSTQFKTNSLRFPSHIRYRSDL